MGTPADSCAQEGLGLGLGAGGCGQFSTDTWRGRPGPDRDSREDGQQHPPERGFRDHMARVQIPFSSITSCNAGEAT